MRFNNTNVTINPSELCVVRKLHALSERRWVSCGLLFATVAMLVGCQSLQTSPLVKKARSIGRKSTDTAPSEKRKPFSLEAITGVQKNQPPVRPSSMINRDISPSLTGQAGNDTLLNKSSPLNLENVGLGDSKVHIEAGDIEDIANSTRNQLPSFMESAVHPFANDTPKATLTDQATSIAARHLGDSMSPNDPTGNGKSQATQMSLGDRVASRSIQQSAANQSMPNQTARRQAVAPQAIAQTSPPSNQAQIVSANDLLAQEASSPQNAQQRFQLGDSTPNAQVSPSPKALTTPPATGTSPPAKYVLQPPKLPEQTQPSTAMNPGIPQELPKQKLPERYAGQSAIPPAQITDGISQAPPTQYADNPIVAAPPAQPIEQANMMKIVADSTGQRSDGFSANVARLFADQQQPTASPIPGGESTKSATADQVRQVGYDEPAEYVAAANYTFSDTRSGSSIEATAAPPLAEKSNRATLLAPADSPMAPSRSTRAANNTRIANNTSKAKLNATSASAWHQPLDVAIRELDSQLSSNTEAGAELEQRIRLHLMKLVAGEQVSGQLDLTDIDPTRRQFWEHQIRALEILLNQDNSQGIPESAAQRRRATMAAEQLAIASDHLANESGMKLRNCEFSTEVLGYGQIRHAEGPFQSGQQLLIYCEIENYSLRKASGGRTAQRQPMLEAELQGLYSIVDQDNRVVHQFEFQPVKDISTRRRNDFYMFFPVTLPKLESGRYQLHLSVEDRVGHKVAGSRDELTFEIAPAGRTANRAKQTQTNYSAPNRRR